MPFERYTAIMNRYALFHSVVEHIQLDFSRSSGPGGQNVNKLNTKATARLKLSDLDGLNSDELALIREKLSGRITIQDEIVLSVQEERSQIRNREIAVARMTEVVMRAARKPRLRIPTAPSRASKERKLASKHIRGVSKRNRQKPSMDDAY